MAPTIAESGEHALIERLRARVGARPDWVHTGIGDDGALLEPEGGMLVALTTDALIEGVHFRLAWSTPGAIGHKALAVSLSDLAAMGAEPRASLLSLALPATFALSAFDEMIDGFVTFADASHAALVGGNITMSPGPLMLDVTAVGAVRRRRALRRATGRAGDELYVTGSIGAAATGLKWRQSGADLATLDAAAVDCVARYDRPQPRLRCGLIASRSRTTTTAIDLSDGLADAVRQIAVASRTGAVVDADALPLHPGAVAWCEANARDPILHGLSGGEDYELLFAVSPRRRRGFLAITAQWGDVPTTRIGRLTAEPGLWLRRGEAMEPLPAGFVHF